LKITPLESRWSAVHRRFSNNPERFHSVDGSVETWSREITRPDDLPTDCAGLVDASFEAFPYCVRTPALRYQDRAEPESFLMLEGETLMVLKRVGDALTVFRCEVGALDALATETSLLQSRITFYPRDGKPVSVPFNSVVEDLFAPVVAAYLRARGTSAEESAQLGSVRPDPLEDLRARDHKYHAYANEVLPGDVARSRFYHPTEAVPALLNRSRLIPSYLLVGSASMLYVLSGKQPYRSRNGSDYSLMVRYLPISPDSSIGYRAIPGESRHRMMTLRAGTATFELPLARSAEAEFAAFAQTVQLPVLPVGAAGLSFEDQKVG